MEVGTIIALLIALAAVVVSFVSVQTMRTQIAASVEIAEKQIKAQLVSANRQKWIEQLRSHVAQYVSEVDQVSTSVVAGTYPHENAIKMNHLKNIVLLHLSPEIESHGKLWSVMNEITPYLTGLVEEGPKPRDTHTQRAIRDELAAKTGAVLELAHNCFGRESELIKRGE